MQQTQMQHLLKWLSQLNPQGFTEPLSEGASESLVTESSNIPLSLRAYLKGVSERVALKQIIGLAGSDPVPTARWQLNEANRTSVVKKTHAEAYF